jgi:hypothetical protein
MCVERLIIGCNFVFRLHFHVICIAATATLLVGGCGLPNAVTYTDPNPSGIFPGTQRDVTATYGRAAVERTRSFLQLRARVQAALLAMTLRQPDEARAHLEAASQESLVTALGAVGIASPREVPPIIAAWTATGAPPPPASDVADLGTPGSGGLPSQATLRTLDRVLRDRERLVMPTSSRLDPGWNGAIAALLVEDAAMAFEQSSLDDSVLDDTDSADNPSGIEDTPTAQSQRSASIAYTSALLQVCRELVDRIPAQRRQLFLTSIDSFERSFLTPQHPYATSPTAEASDARRSDGATSHAQRSDGATPQAQKSDGGTSHDGRMDDVYAETEQLSTLLQQAGGAIAESGEPRPQAPACLKQAAEQVARIVGPRPLIGAHNAGSKRTSSTAAALPVSASAKIDQIVVKVTRYVTTCSDDIAAVDPLAMGRVEYAVGVSLPAVLHGATTSSERNDLAASIDTELDQARTLVMDELAALKEE